MTLWLYVARRFLFMFALVFAVFFGIMLMVETIEQVRRLAGTDAGLGEATALALLGVPASLYRILPLVTILAAVALFLMLARTSELVVMRATGRSGLATLTAPVATALVIGAVAVAVLNPIAAGTSKRAEELSARYSLGSGNVLSVSREGLWLRQGGAAGQSVIRAAQSNQDGTVLHDVTFVTFATGARPSSRIEAREARLDEGAWVLTDAKEWQLAGETVAERGAVLHDTLRVPSELTADQIRDSFGAPSVIPVWDLPAFIDSLTRAGFSARQHQVWFQTELALPLLLAAMVLVGAGLTMRHARFGRSGMMALLSMIAGFAIFFLRNFAQVLGENGHIPVALAAWGPPVVAILLSLSLVLHLEDG